MARSRVGVALASVVLAVLLASTAAVLTARPGEGQTATVTLVGAGDLPLRQQGRYGHRQARKLHPWHDVHRRRQRLQGRDPLAVQKLLRSHLGRFKARTKLSVGNHEYRTPGASGYFDYFGAAAGERGKGYYSYNRGAWHIVALNSECAYVQGGCEAGSLMITWLKNDLAAHPRRCTLAYFHKPLFSSGYSRGNPVVKPLWNALYAAHADVIVSGHDHVYSGLRKDWPSVQGRLQVSGFR